VTATVLEGQARGPSRLAAAGRRLIRGREDAAAWERPALLALLGVTAVLYLVDISVSGWANSFYSAAAQAGSVDWTAFFYGSSDAANSITVDKPPASLWFMALSVRLFGLSSFSILLPQALMGVATVGVLYATVRRRFPVGTALLAGGILAITPVAALMFRYNNPDALLVLLSSLAIYFTLRGIESGALKWVLWAGVMVGFAFLTKQLQAFLVLPVLAGVYLWAAPGRIVTRAWHALAALGAVVVSAGWWVAVVQLVPASLRPYIGGSQTNSFLELTFGYNGLGRLTGQETGSVSGGVQHWGDTGPLRLFSGDIAGQIAWLLPAAIISTAVALILMRRLPRTAPTRAIVLLLGGTLVVTALAFSFMQGIFHAYYTVAIAPMVAGAVAIGAGMLWSRRERLWARVTMAGLVLGSALLAWGVLLLAGSWLPWLKVVILCLGVVGAVLLLVVFGGRGMRRVAASTALVAVLLGPLAYTLETISTGHSGSIVTAGPGVSGGSRPVIAGAHKGPLLPPSSLGQSKPAAPVPPARPGATGPLSLGGLLNSGSVTAQLAKAISQNASSFTWAAAALGSNVAAGYQLATGYPVMAVGGFNGSDPSPTLAQFQALVAEGRIHWFIGSAVGRPNGGSRDAAAISAWVIANYAPTTIGFTRLYDLSKR
jgi:4-amino-4-deoxy-L-arabinose transferase-like glycosyltransferase